MMNYKSIFIAVFASLVITSCKEDKPAKPVEKQSVFLTTNMTVDSIDVGLNQNLTVPGAHWLKVEGMKFYLSRIQLQNTSNEWVTASSVEYFSMADGKNTVEMSLPKGSYKKVKFIVGLDAALNATDPNSVSIDHPLSSSKAMYWSWALKYRFLILEGRTLFDNNGTDSLMLLNYHPGADELGYLKEFEYSVNLGSVADTLNFGIEVPSVFDGPGGQVDFLTENSTHMENAAQYAIGEKLLMNFAASFYPKP